MKRMETKWWRKKKKIAYIQSGYEYKNVQFIVNFECHHQSLPQLDTNFWLVWLPFASFFIRSFNVQLLPVCDFESFSFPFHSITIFTLRYVLVCCQMVCLFRHISGLAVGVIVFHTYHRLFIWPSFTDANKHIYAYPECLTL